MNKFKVAASALAVIAAGTVLVLEHLTVARLREQNQALKHQLEQFTGQTTPVLPRRLTSPRLPAPRLTAATPAAEPGTNPVSPANIMAKLIDRNHTGQLSPQQLDVFLRDNARSADSLLAAFRATEDRSFLREALEKFPQDPRVNFAACIDTLNRPESTAEERRHQLEAFKQSAADNALPNYLSAREYFKSGQADQAVLELMAASSKSQCQDYSVEFLQDTEEAYLAAGYSQAEAKAVAASYLPLPQLAPLRQLGENIAELAESYRQAGDQASAQAALQIGLALAQRVGSPPGSTYLINEQVGLKIESRLLQNLDPASLYDDGQTVQNRLSTLNRRQEEIKRLGDPSTWLGGERRNVLEALSERMPPQELINYFDRVKTAGEEAALRWALYKLGQP